MHFIHCKSYLFDKIICTTSSLNSLEGKSTTNSVAHHQATNTNLRKTSIRFVNPKIERKFVELRMDLSSGPDFQLTQPYKLCQFSKFQKNITTRRSPIRVLKYLFVALFQIQRSELFSLGASGTWSIKDGESPT